MKTTTKYLSKEAAIGNVKKFFSNTNGDSVSIEEAFTAWERDLTQSGKNKGWLSNKLVDLKYHNLVVPIYGMRNNRRTLIKIQLTLEGKRALGKVGGNQEDSIENVPVQNGEASLSIEQILKAMPRIKKENPDFDINFSVTPKEG